MYYTTRIQGHLDPAWQDHFGGLGIEQQENGTTLLSGTLPDQAALHGVLLQIVRLGLTLLSLETSSKVFNLNEDKEIVMSQSEKKITQESTGSTETTTNKYKGFSAEERAAMKERAKEQKAEARASKSREEGESDVLAKIAEMPEPDRSMATRIHEIIKENAPVLAPKTWYGMPAYARDGKIVCSFRPTPKFNTRYATFSFEDSAKLDEGAMWATAFALKELTDEGEAKIAALVKQAVN